MADAALLDVAQDYALKYIHDQGLFDLGVVLKGGAALRKLRAGNAGRFSTDLDFMAPDADTAVLALDVLDGAELFGVRFRVEQRELLRASLVVETPLGRPQIPARIEFSLRPLWLPVRRAIPIALPVHAGYEFKLPPTPTPALEESLSEKLAAWRRRQKVRDLYDLFIFGRGALNEPLVRRLLVLKVWHDVVVDGLGSHPFDPEEIVADINTGRLPSEDIGLLTHPVDPAAWLAAVRSRYAFVTALDPVERRIARCQQGDRHEVSLLVAALQSSRFIR